MCEGRSYHTEFAEQTLRDTVILTAGCAKYRCNKLPISYNIAWYEQKAVIVLPALLFPDVKDIHLGSTLPAFLSPDTADVPVETFALPVSAKVFRTTRNCSWEPKLQRKANQRE